jgi:hypothetical protein
VLTNDCRSSGAGLGRRWEEARHEAGRDWRDPQRAGIQGGPGVQILEYRYRSGLVRPTLPTKTLQFLRRSMRIYISTQPCATGLRRITLSIPICVGKPSQLTGSCYKGGLCNSPNLVSYSLRAAKEPLSDFVDSLFLSVMSRGFPPFVTVKSRAPTLLLVDHCPACFRFHPVQRVFAPKRLPALFPPLGSSPSSAHSFTRTSFTTKLAKVI